LRDDDGPGTTGESSRRRAHHRHDAQCRIEGRGGAPRRLREDSPVVPHEVVRPANCPTTGWRPRLTGARASRHMPASWPLSARPSVAAVLAPRPLAPAVAMRSAPWLP